MFVHIQIGDMNNELDWESIRSSPRDGLSTAYDWGFGGFGD